MCCKKFNMAVTSKVRPGSRAFQGDSRYETGDSDYEDENNVALAEAIRTVATSLDVKRIYYKGVEYTLSLPVVSEKG